LLQPFLPSFACASLLVGLAATAQAAPRSVVLTGKAGEAPLISLAPSSFTFIILDAPIVRESVQVEGRARFARVDPGDQSITLALAAPLGPMERLALRFAYREGSPVSVVFLLTGQPGEADTVVNVSRPQQTVEACRVELSTTRERWEAQGKELEELRARPPAISPASLALAGIVDWRGLRFGRIRECSLVRGELRPVQCTALGAPKWTVLVLEVSNTGAESWAPAWADVTPAAGGEPRRARTVFPTQITIPPGGSVSLAVEVEMPERAMEDWLRESHTLRVCDAAGSRCFSVPQVRL
jgi:uncharacterized protein (TIGR02268 family)